MTFEDWFVRSDGGLHGHCVLTELARALLLPLDQAGHRCQQQQGGHDGDGDDQDEQHAVRSRAGAGVGFWKNKTDLESCCRLEKHSVKMNRHWFLSKHDLENC